MHCIKSPLLRRLPQVRHPSWACDECYQMLADRGVALVAADTAGRFPYMEVGPTVGDLLLAHSSRGLSLVPILRSSSQRCRHRCRHCCQCRSAPWNSASSTLLGCA